MDTVHAAGQSQTIASPLPVQDRRPAQGTVDKRAVERTARDSAPNTQDRRPLSEPEAPVVRLVRDFAYQLEATLNQMEKDAEAAQAESQDVVSTGETGAPRVDVYA